MRVPASKDKIHLVCIIPDTFNTSSGGAELQVHYISEYLTQHYQNIRVTVLTRNSPHDNQIYSVKNWGGRDSKWPPLEWVKIHKSLDKINPDIIYQRRGNAYTGIVAHYCGKRRIPMIWHVAHENNLLPFNYHFNISLIYRRLNNALKNWGIRRANAVICQTEQQKILLKENFNIECDSILPNVSPNFSGRIRKDRDKIHVVWIANFRPFKKPEIFLALARAIKKENIVFHMAGRAGIKWWSQLLKKINETPNLIYHGEMELDEVNELLCRSHILVNTSEREGFPNTFLQAWIRKVPVVSLLVDPDNIIEYNNLGFCSGNFEQLKNDVLFFAENPTQTREVGENARKYCLKNHSMKNVDLLVSLINKLING